jgi:hypothetical protein
MDLNLITRRFILKRAKLVALAQQGSAALVCVGSIWLGAWFPDAQSELHTVLKKSSPSASKPSFWAVTKSGWQLDSPVPYTILGVVLSAIAGIGVYVTAARVDELEKVAGDFEIEQEAHAETQRHYLQSLHEHLKSYYCSRIPNFDDSCRASIYRHDVQNNVVRMVFRYCAFTRWNHKGRVSIPANEGIVGAVMENTGNVYVNKLPPKANLKKYARATNKTLESHGTLIPESTLQQLRMPSRSYYGFAIRDLQRDTKFAVLVLESTNEDHFDPEKVKEVLEFDSPISTQYVQHITRLDSLLNPYGGA